MNADRVGDNGCEAVLGPRQFAQIHDGGARSGVIGRKSRRHLVVLQRFATTRRTLNQKA